ncbi:uncharacterized protein KY384_001240 [Bacidia gigantensis]|uniref:uncharacterized protein n=1 Tax=Bacidia gigantensis TaxID=2732470 RepID=UPI001D04D411|nr:uncharacterized protein KY384_001240 [Bacidia gigantensis]KAG8534395.1 hypothetical protein KY384_001240 [Bacidia gigantensis]
MASQTAFAPPDAWTRAVNRFTEDLDDDEKHLFFQASPETILYEASAAEKTQKSKTRHFLEKIQPCIESIEDYGRALDVFANTYPLVMSPLWGSIRIVLHVKIVEMFTQISDLLPRLHVYEALFPDHERLVQALSLVYSDIINFCSEAKHALRKPKRAMFGSSWKTFKRQFGHRIESFNRHQRSIDKEVDVSHMIESAKTTDQIQANQLEVAKERKGRDPPRHDF